MLIILSGIGVGLPPLLADMKRLLRSKKHRKTFNKRGSSATYL